MAGFETIAGPGTPEPSPLDGADVVQTRPCSIYVRNAAGDGNSVHVTLPASWEKAAVGRLVSLLARRWALPTWDVHLETRRGALANSDLLFAVLVRRESVTLKRGPTPSADSAGGAGAARSQLWVWGRRVDSSVSAAPVRQPGLSVHLPCEVALGAEHVLLVTRAGLALSWGRNGAGQLGTGDEVARPSPALVRALSGTACARAASGLRCSAVVAADGLLWTWGELQPANAPLPLHSSWVNRHGATECGLLVREVAFGGEHTIVLTGAGAVWTFGYNQGSCLGWPAAAAAGGTALRHGFQKPREALTLPLPAVCVAAGALHSAAVLQDGTLYAWGDNSCGQCGCGGGGALPLPTSVPAFDFGAEPIARVRCVGGTTVAIARSGRCYLLGGGARVALAHSSDNYEADGEAVSAGASDAQADGDATGGASVGESGGESGGATQAPSGGGARDAGGHGAVRDGGLSAALGLKRMLGEAIRDVALADDHALLLAEGAPTLGMGYNRYGQAAPGSRRLRLGAPRPIDASLFGGERLLQLAACGGASAALSEGVAPSLRARSAAALLAALAAPAPNLPVCVQLLQWGLGGLAAPELGLGAVVVQCLRCAAAHRESVARLWRNAGLELEKLHEALGALEEAAAAP